LGAFLKVGMFYCGDQGEGNAKDEKEEEDYLRAGKRPAHFVALSRPRSQEGTGVDAWSTYI